MPAAPRTRNAHLLLDGEPIGLDRFADVVAAKVIESSWSMKMANEIIATSRRKKMRNR
jgi:hypothetical protein